MKLKMPTITQVASIIVAVLMILSYFFGWDLSSNVVQITNATNWNDLIYAGVFSVTAIIAKLKANQIKKQSETTENTELK